MKTILLTENKLNILLEYGGFVNGWQKLIEYVYSYSYENLFKYIKSIVKNTQNKSSEEIFYEFENYVNDNIDFKELVIPEKHLKMLNVYGVKNITIKYIIDNNIDGGFDYKSLSIDKDGKLNNFTIIINYKKMFFNR